MKSHRRLFCYFEGFLVILYADVMNLFVRSYDMYDISQDTVNSEFTSGKFALYSVCTDRVTLLNGHRLNTVFIDYI